VVAAGDAFLSYGEYGKAITFYERSLTMPGVKLDEELNRLAIAQIGAGDYAGARESLSRITGARMPLAMLWSAYASELETPAAPAPAVAPSSAPAMSAQ
jgi:tetratricopeptide (TPR) repeat protein